MITEAPVIVLVMVAPVFQSIEGAEVVVLVQCPLHIDIAGVLNDHGQGGVPQQQAQRIDVHAVLQAVGSEVVPEAVDAAALNAGPSFKVGDDHLDAACCHVLVVGGSPEHLTGRGPDVKVVLQCFPGLPVDGYHPELGALAQDPHLSQFGVEVRQLDVGQLR